MIKIPHMGAHSIGPYLEAAVMCAKPGTAIVELGAWLGAGTSHLAKTEATVHTFDIFETKGNEVKKAAMQGVDIKHGQDTLPLVKEYLKEFNNIVYYKGKITNQKWAGPKISVYVDDACKMPEEFKYAINTFSPFWVPGGTIVILMDFYYYQHRPEIPELICQKEYMDKNSINFKLLKSWPSCSCATFLYLGGDVTYK